MDARARKAHWESVYGTKAEAQVSWFQKAATTSLALLDVPSLDRDSAIIDIGGGLSRLVDGLIERGHVNVSVLDVSPSALAAAQARLGPKKAALVRWIEADITRWQPRAQYDAWHDRAVLHFLINEADRTAYLDVLRKALRPGGLVVIATFALDGPDKCSGLPVQRYSSETLSALLGPEFTLLDSRGEAHRTPSGVEQKFQYSRFRRRA